MRLSLIASALVCTAAFAPQARLYSSPRRAFRVQSLQMIDQNVLVGGAVALSGFATGIAMAYFAEQQIVRAESRGSEVISDTTRAKMSAMFMEDEVMPEAGLDDTVRRMEEAMAKAKGEDTSAREEKEPVAVQPKDDGW
ncbi:hypothetical protein CTAYLR_007446 [Chrysophaeum taylorii]|uniref:Uncharacterized protein n=1 Tax=Chrysophaeum taylorii TaxID=2483200 RepID=A0AAD7XLR2_9STRA|nr:hypothetical protein CTAYLR_007446 [Chrysophaeum taylorii]